MLSMLSMLSIPALRQGVFTIPFMLSALLGDALGGATGVSLEPWPLLQQLIGTILLPTMVGAAARELVPGELGVVGGGWRRLEAAGGASLHPAAAPTSPIRRPRFACSGGNNIFLLLPRGVVEICFLALLHRFHIFKGLASVIVDSRKRVVVIVCHDDRHDPGTRHDDTPLYPCPLLRAGQAR